MESRSANLLAVAATLASVMIAACELVPPGLPAGKPPPERSQPLAGPLGVYRLDDGQMKAMPGLGLFGIAPVLADLDGDGALDLVLSAGEYAAPQPLVVYYNTRGQRPFRDYPSWFSDTIEHRGALAVGDINGDGKLDVVVPVLFSRQRRPGTNQPFESGVIEVFLNEGGRLPSRPSYVLNVPDTPLSAALADVNGDGRLDLAVASIARGERGETLPATQYIYYNRGGTLSGESPAVGPKLAVVSLLFADLDQDGWIDLITGGDRVNVFRGDHGAFGQAPIQLEPKFHAAFGLAAGPVNTAQRAQSLFVADNCREAKCDRTDLWYFRGEMSGQLDRKGSVLRQLDNGSHIALVDANHDQTSDLIVTQLGARERGAPLLLLEGTGTGSWPFVYQSNGIGGEGIAVGDVMLHDVKQRRFRIENHAGSIVTLPVSHVEQVQEVYVDGQQLTADRFTWVPGTNWIALAHPDHAVHTVEVETAWSRRDSLVVASHDPTVGGHLLISRYRFP